MSSVFRAAMGAEDDALAGGHLVEALDKDSAFAFEGFEYEAIVHDLMSHIERPPVGAERAADGLDGPIHPRADPARLSQDDFLYRNFAQRHPTFVTGNCPVGQ